MPETETKIDACSTLLRIMGRLEGCACALSMLSERLETKEIASMLRDASLNINEILQTHQITPVK